MLPIYPYLGLALLCLVRDLHSNCNRVSMKCFISLSRMSLQIGSSTVEYLEHCARLFLYSPKAFSHLLNRENLTLCIRLLPYNLLTRSKHTVLYSRNKHSCSSHFEAFSTNHMSPCFHLVVRPIEERVQTHSLNLVKHPLTWQITHLPD